MLRLSRALNCKRRRPRHQQRAGLIGGDAAERLASSEKGEVLPRGVGTLRFLVPPKASLHWQPDGFCKPHQKVAPRSRTPRSTSHTVTIAMTVSITITITVTITMTITITITPISLGSPGSPARLNPSRTAMVEPKRGLVNQRLVRSRLLHQLIVIHD